MEQEFTGINKIFKSKLLQKFITSLSDGTFKELVNDWKWIFGYSKNYKGKIVLYTVLGIVSSTISLVGAYITRTLINVITEKQAGTLVTMGIAYVSATIISILLSSFKGRLALKLSIFVRNDIQKDIFTNVMDADWLSTNQYPNGDIVNRFTDDVGTVAGHAVSWIPDVIVVSYSFIITFIVMFRMDPTMAFIALLSAPFLLIISRFVISRMREYKKAVQEMKSKLMAFEVESFYNADIFKSFGIIKNATKSLVDKQKESQDLDLEYNMFEIKTKMAMSFISFAVSCLAFGYCLFRLWSGKILFGDMTFFLSRRSSLSSSFSSLVNLVPNIISAAVAAKRIKELIELPPEKHNPESLEAIKKYAESGLTVTMNNVSFSYDGNKSVYDNCNFVARPNEIIAVLGPSGEGKTTMLRLLLGLTYPQNGSVLLTGSDGTNVDMNADLRSLFAYVPQGNTMLSGTIAENLRMVKPDATDDEIIDVLKTACAWEFVSKIPETINSSVGEKGKGLSEGQAQRVAIARAILNNAPIMLLDEATSALDEETEKSVLQSIIKKEENKTCIVSTHRKSVLKQCSRIYVIKDNHFTEYTSLDEYLQSV